VREIPPAIRNSRFLEQIDVTSMLYCLAVLWPIIAFGAVRPFGVSAACLGMVALGLAVLLTKGVARNTMPPLLAAGVLLLVSEAWAVYQARPDWFLFVGANRPTISIQPSDSLYSVQVFSFPALAFVVGLLVLREDVKARFAMHFLMMAAAAIIMLAAAFFISDPGYILSFHKTAYFDSFTATLVNRNNAGTLIGAVVLLILRQFWSSCRSIRAFDLFQAVFFWKMEKRREVLKALFYGILLSGHIVALFLTKSRGAIFCTLLGFVVLVSFLFWMRQKRRYSGSAFVVRICFGATALFVLILTAFLLVGERVAMRTAIMGARDPRLCVMPGLLRTLKEYFWVGSGAGTFQMAFAPNREPECGLLYVWEKAHNTYLQNWIEFGVLAPCLTIILLGGLIMSFVWAIRTLARQRSYPALGLALVILMASNSAVDFPVEIPGISGFVAAILAMVTVICKAQFTTNATSERSSLPQHI